MPKRGRTLQNLKDEYVKYFEDVPVQKYAAQYIGRDEDTIIRWKHTDTQFADRIKKAESKWVRRKLLKTKAEFALERLQASIFKQQPKPLPALPDKSYTVIYRPQKLPDKYWEKH